MTIQEQIKKEAERQHPTYFGHQKAFIDGANWLLSTLQVPVWVKAEDEQPTETNLYHVKMTDSYNDRWDAVRNYKQHVGWDYTRTNEKVYEWLKLPGEPLLPLIEAKKKIEELEREIVSLKDEILKLKQ